MKKYGIPMMIVLSITVLLCCYYNFKYAPETIVSAGKHFYKDSLSCVPGEILRIKVDSVTDPANITYFENINDHNRDIVCFLNKEANMIYQYDLATQVLKRSVNLNFYGYKQGDKIQGFHFLNSDSLLIYSYQRTQLSLLSLSKGKLLSKSFNNGVDMQFSDVYPMVSTGAPILYDMHSHDVFLTGYASDEGGTYDEGKEENVLAVFNIKNGYSNFFLHYPEFYWGKNWGGGGGLRPSSVDLNDTGQLVVSFKADHSITVVDPRQHNHQETHFAGSKFFKSTKSMPFSGNYFDFISEMDVFKYYCQTPCYSTIKFDRYHRCYYRFAELANPTPRLDRAGIEFKRRSLIILNGAFKKCGEILLPANQYRAYNSFIGRNGLYLQLRTNNDKEIQFQCFKLKRNS